MLRSLAEVSPEPVGAGARASAPFRWTSALLRTAAVVVLGVVSAVSGTAWAQSKQLLEYPAIHQPVVGEHGMVVSQNQLASRIGASTLEKGGNAIDAAVATAFALAVVLPRAGNIGGDGFMLIYVAGLDKVVSIDYRSVAPRAARLDMFVAANGEQSKEASHGYRAAAVPGTVAGLFLAQQRYGKLRWATLLEPAIRLARDGFVLSPDEAFVFGWARDRLSASDVGRRTFYKPDGSLYRAGEALRQPQLAWALREIARHGADAFYHGPIAKKLASDMAAHGGLISLEDLAAYRAVEREPLRGTYRGFTVYTMPPASAGGATLLEMLNILENFDLQSMGAGSAQVTHVMAEAMKLGYADRYRFLGDTDFVPVPLRGFVSKEYAAERAKLISLETARPAEQLGAGDVWKYESKQTTHFSIADAHGNAVSNTFTLGADFGSGVVVEGAGFVLNNQMNNFAHVAAVQAARSGGEPPPNAMAPGKRMLSTMAPTMLFQDGKPWLVTGTPGGGTIIDTILQVIVNAVDFRLNIAEASHLPRIYQNAEDSLEVEPDFNPDTLALLKAKGHPVKAGETMGSAQSIMIEKGLFLGGADPRRPGALAVAP